MDWEFIDGTTKISYSIGEGDKVIISFNCPIKNGEHDGQFITTLRNFIESFGDNNTERLRFFQALETASKPATAAKKRGWRRKAVSSPATDVTTPATELESFLDGYLVEEERDGSLTAGQIEEIRMAFDPNYRNYVEACDLQDRLKNYYQMARNITATVDDKGKRLKKADQSHLIKLYKNAPKTGPKTYSEYSIDTSPIVKLYQDEKAKGKRGNGHAKKQVDPKTKKQLRIAALVTGTPLGMITGTSKKAGFNDGDVFAQLHFDPDFDSAEKQRLMIDVLGSDNNKKYLTSIGEASIASEATKRHDITLRDLQSYLQKVSPNAYRSAGYRDFATSYEQSDHFSKRADRISSSNLAQIEAILNLAQEQGIAIDENTQVSEFLANQKIGDRNKTNAEILREQVQAYTAERRYQSPLRYGYKPPEKTIEEVDIKKAAKAKKAKVTIAGKKAEKPTFYSSQFKFTGAGGKARLVSLPHVSSLPELRISDKKGTLSEDFSLSMEAILNKSPEYSNLIIRSEAIVLGNSYTETIRSIVPPAEAAGLQQAIKAQKSVYDKFFSGRDNNVKLNAASQLYVLNDHINRMHGSSLDEEVKSAYNATLAFIAKAIVTQKKFLEYTNTEFGTLLDQVSQIPKDQRNAVLNAVAIPLDEEVLLTTLTGKVTEKVQSLSAVRRVEDGSSYQPDFPPFREESFPAQFDGTTLDKGQFEPPTPDGQDLFESQSHLYHDGWDLLDQGRTPTPYRRDLLDQGSFGTDGWDLLGQGRTPTPDGQDLSGWGRTPTPDRRDLLDQGRTPTPDGQDLSGQQKHLSIILEEDVSQSGSEASRRESFSSTSSIGSSDSSVLSSSPDQTMRDRRTDRQPSPSLRLDGKSTLRLDRRNVTKICSVDL